MLQHIKNTPTKYQFAMKNQSGETVFTLWLTRKSINDAIRLAAETIVRICQETNTSENQWEFNRENKTIFNTKAGIIGKFTGSTLRDVRGTREN